MTENIKDEILEVYETLIENGVTFYYGSEVIPTGEVTGFNIIEGEYIEIEVEIEGFETYQISVEDFEEYHSKEGANYHTWPEIRKFDKKLSIMNN